MLGLYVLDDVVHYDDVIFLVIRKREEAVDKRAGETGLREEGLGILDLPGSTRPLRSLRSLLPRMAGVCRLLRILSPGLRIRKSS